METPDIKLGQQDGTGLGPLLVGALINAFALYSIGISTAGPQTVSVNGKQERGCAGHHNGQNFEFA